MSWNPNWWLHKRIRFLRACASSHLDLPVLLIHSRNERNLFYQHYETVVRLGYCTLVSCMTFQFPIYRLASGSNGINNRMKTHKKEEVNCRSQHRYPPTQFRLLVQFGNMQQTTSGSSNEHRRIDLLFTVPPPHQYNRTQITSFYFRFFFVTFGPEEREETYTKANEEVVIDANATRDVNG